MADPKSLTRADLALFLPNNRAIRAFEELFDLIPDELFEILRQARNAEINAGTALTASRSALQAANDADLSRKGFVVVSRLRDLPKAISGAINLRDEYTYFFANRIDLEGLRLVGGQNTTILGGSSENSGVSSTGLASGTPLISSEWSLPIRHITLSAATVFDLDATANANQALDWYGVNISNTSDIGLIKNYNNFVASSMAFLSASGLVFDGTFGTIGLSDTLFTGTNPGTVITIPSAATITRRIRVSYSSFIVSGAGVALNVSTSASIPVEGYILDTCNFSGGGTYTSGVQYNDNKARFNENRGIKNSAAIAGYYMHGNATATTIAGTATPTKVAGTTTATAISQRFTITTTNRATYIGAIEREFRISLVCNLSSGAGHQVGIYIAKNGTPMSESETYVTTNAGGRVENGSAQVLTTLVDTDYIEVFVENNTLATDITVEDLNIIIEALN